MGAITVRPARPGDAEAIRTIYNDAVLNTTFTFDLRPRTLEEQQAWMDARSGAHVVLVATDEGEEVLGFASLSPYRDRPAYATTVENSVYVAADHRGGGVGRLLMEELVERARNHGFHTMIARIVDGHDASIALHAAVGFEVVGVEREVGRKFGKWLDVRLMQCML